jgi:hypothetical protein
MSLIVFESIESKVVVFSKALIVNNNISFEIIFKYLSLKLIQNNPINLFYLDQIFSDLVSVKDVLEDINLDKGFVSNYNPYLYPIIGDYLHKLVNIKKWEDFTCYERINIYK